VTTTDDRELPGAQVALATAKAHLAEVHEKVTAGDPSVSGADLVAAEADVRAAEMFEVGARQRDVARQEAENERAIEAARTRLQEEYRATAAEVSAKAAAALGALTELIDACANHEARTQSNLAAAKMTERKLLGFGILHTAEPVAIVDALRTEALRRAGEPTGFPHPHQAVGPVAPFLADAAR